jgi:chloride channel 3/4/5
VQFVHDMDSRSSFSSTGGDRLLDIGARSTIKANAIGILESSKTWLVLLWTGVSVAVLAAGIDIVSQWLGSAKFGFCNAAFYLNQDFCCWAGTNAAGNAEKSITCPQWSPWAPNSYILRYLIYIVLTISFAVIASVLVSRFSLDSRLSGIPDIKTIVDGAVRPHFLAFKTLIIKTLGLCLIVGAGLWVGKEGPLVHMACCCANLAVSALFPSKKNSTIREILPAASAAGISVAFGAPIGGVVFALEAISSYYSNDARILWHSFVCAMVGAVTLHTMNPFRTGKLVLFQVVYDRLWHRFELFPFAVIGVLGGLYGAAMIRLNMKFVLWRKSVPLLKAMPPVVEVAAVGLVTGIISFPVLYMRMQSSLALSYLFQECSVDTPGHLCDVNYWFSTVVLLVFSTLVGLVLTSYTFGIDVPAGTLMPTMVAGALGGRAIGLLMQAWQVKHPNFVLFSSCPPNDGSGGVCVTPGVYALVGAASALTGVTRLTVSSVVIIFELTGALNYVLPIMAGVMVSKWVSEAFGRRGIYEMWIYHHMQYPLLDQTRTVPIADVSAANVMTGVDSLTVIPSQDPVTSQFLTSLVQKTPFEGYPIVDTVDNLQIIGYIKRVDLETALNQRDDKSGPVNWYFSEPPPDPTGTGMFTGVDLRDVMDSFPTRLSLRVDFVLVVNMFQALGLNYVLFTDRGKLAGLMTKRDVWLYVNSSEDLLLSEHHQPEEDHSPVSTATNSPSQFGVDHPLLGGGEHMDL